MNLLSPLMFAGVREPLQTKGAECANSTRWNQTRPLLAVRQFYAFPVYITSGVLEHNVLEP